MSTFLVRWKVGRCDHKKTILHLFLVFVQFWQITVCDPRNSHAHIVIVFNPLLGYRTVHWAVRLLNDWMHVYRHRAIVIYWHKRMKRMDVCHLSRDWTIHGRKQFVCVMCMCFSVCAHACDVTDRPFNYLHWAVFCTLILFFATFSAVGSTLGEWVRSVIAFRRLR